VSRPRPTIGFRIVAAVVIGAVRALRWRVTTVGLDHLPTDGGAVITWQHNSHVDFLATALDVYRRLGRPVAALGMRELWRHPLLGWLPRLAGAVPVDRASDVGRDQALAAAVAALRDGHLVLVAPEAGIQPSFEVAPFRTGAVRMAQLAGVPVVPSVSWGTQRLSTTGHRVDLRAAWRLAVTVRFGAPMHVATDADAATVAADLRAVTARMLDDVQRTYVDGAPAGAPWVPRRLGGGAPPPAFDPVRPDQDRPDDEPSA
jgi:1-acyl-sn-glycerol-3-phosphate acyltransferase